MKFYIIKKQIKAKTPMEALRNEKKGEIIGIWQVKQEQRELSPAIGFVIDNKEEKEEYEK